MKTFITLLAFVFLTSCLPSVRKINDTVRNEEKYLSTFNKGTRSKVNLIYRYFTVTAKKIKNDSTYVYFNVNSSFPVTQPDYFDSTYLVLPHQNFSYKFEHAGENIRYKEKVDEITATTNTSTNIQVQNTTKVEPITVDNTSTETRDKEVTTDTQTTTTTSSNTDTRVNTEILDKVRSERLIKINIKHLKIASNYTTVSIRLYSLRNDDFWDIKLTSSDLKVLMQLINHQATY